MNKQTKKKYYFPIFLSILFTFFPNILFFSAYHSYSNRSNNNNNDNDDNDNDNNNGNDNDNNNNQNNNNF